jgi:hypothetical protein
VTPAGAACRADEDDLTVRSFQSQHARRYLRAMNIKRLAAAAALSMSVVAFPSAAQAGDFECRGSYGAVTLVGNVIVPDDSQCSLSGTYVQGAIVVKSRAALHATGITTTGGIQGESPARVVIDASELGNGVQLRKGGPVDITGTSITGDIALEENLAQVTLTDNVLTGSIQANKNTGGLTITGNQIGNGLQCQENTPPPTGGGNVAKQKQAQCVHL